MVTAVVDFSFENSPAFCIRHSFGMQLATNNLRSSKRLEKMLREFVRAIFAPFLYLHSCSWGELLSMVRSCLDCTILPVSHGQKKWPFTHQLLISGLEKCHQRLQSQEERQGLARKGVKIGILTIKVLLCTSLICIPWPRSSMTSKRTYTHTVDFISMAFLDPACCKSV